MVGDSLEDDDPKRIERAHARRTIEPHAALQTAAANEGGGAAGVGAGLGAGMAMGQAMMDAIKKGSASPGSEGGAAAAGGCTAGAAAGVDRMMGRNPADAHAAPPLPTREGKP